MYFVAVRFSDEKIARLFDLARIILQPDYARRSHITLRGPYGAKKDVASGIIGRDVGKITVGRPNSFFEGKQNTVYLNVSILGLADYWWKPDYPEGVPHLTIYDGSDRSLAWATMNVLRRHRWQIALNSTPMHILDTKQRLETEFILSYDALSATIDLAFNSSLSAEQIKKFDNLQRAVALDRICTLIHQLSQQ
jgi:hypothetical protein